MKNLVEVYNLLKKDLDNVQSYLKKILSQESTSEAKIVLDFLMKSQGKQVRPVLVFLSTYVVFGKIEDDKDYEKLLKCAAAVELIHMASLVHDDVIDEADKRRGRPSIRLQFGKLYKQ